MRAPVFRTCNSTLWLASKDCVSRRPIESPRLVEPSSPSACTARPRSAACGVVGLCTKLCRHSLSVGVGLAEDETNQDKPCEAGASVAPAPRFSLDGSGSGYFRITGCCASRSSSAAWKQGGPNAKAIHGPTTACFWFLGYYYDSMQ